MLFVSDMIKNSAVFSSPSKSSPSSSYSVSSRISEMSNGASLAPHEISILFAVLPVAFCQGLFYHAGASTPIGNAKTPLSQYKLNGAMRFLVLMNLRGYAEKSRPSLCNLTAHDSEAGRSAIDNTR